MKRKNTFLLVLTTAIMLAATIGIAYAVDLQTLTGPINALGTGYAITRWIPFSGDIPLGTTVTVRAYTTNDPATTLTDQVEFVWIEPDGTQHPTGLQNLVSSSDTWGVAPSWYAEDDFLIDIPGNWGVQAQFHYKAQTQNDQQPPPPLHVEIRAISWHPFVIPEAPLGTILVSIAMFGALGIFYWKRKSTSAFSNPA